MGILTAPALPLAPTYIPRTPLRTVLHQAVVEGYATLTRRLAENDQTLPAFVREEIEGFITCGDLSQGFVRVHCPDCGHDRIVPFSCKSRAWCPSCVGRQMADTAAYLVEHVIPEVPMRQWVLTLPHPLRYLLAYDASLLSATLDAFMRSLFGSYRHRAKAELDLRSVRQAMPGAVTVIQRAGSSLNLNIHFHTVCTDGVFIMPESATKDAAPEFRVLPAPTDKEIQDVAEETMRRTVAMLKKRGLWVDGEENGLYDRVAEKEPVLAACAQASVMGTLAMGPRAGKRVLRFIGVAADEDHGNRPQAPAVYGFNLHARRRVAARERHELERLLHYILRPPLSYERVTRMYDGHVSVRLVRPWSDGTSAIVLTDEELVQRLIP